MRALVVRKRMRRDWANGYWIVVPNGAYLNGKRDRMNGKRGAILSEKALIKGFGVELRADNTSGRGKLKKPGNDGETQQKKGGLMGEDSILLSRKKTLSAQWEGSQGKSRKDEKEAKVVFASMELLSKITRHF